MTGAARGQGSAPTHRVPVLHDHVPVLRRHVDHCRTSTATCR